MTSSEPEHEATASSENDSWVVRHGALSAVGAFAGLVVIALLIRFSQGTRDERNAGAPVLPSGSSAAVVAPPITEPPSSHPVVFPENIRFTPLQLSLTSQQPSVVAQMELSPPNADMDSVTWDVPRELRMKVQDNVVTVTTNADDVPPNAHKQYDINALQGGKTVGTLAVVVQGSIEEPPTTLAKAVRVLPPSLSLNPDHPSEVVDVQVEPSEVGLSGVEWEVDKGLFVSVESPTTAEIRADISAFKPGAPVDRKVGVRSGGKTLATIAVQVTVPERVKSIECDPQNLLLDEKNTEVEVAYKVHPEGAQSDPIEWKGDPRINISQAGAGRLLVSWRPESLEPGSSVNCSVEGQSRGKTVLSLPVTLSRAPQVQEMEEFAEFTSLVGMSFPKRVSAGTAVELNFTAKNPLSSERIGTLAVSFEGSAVDVLETSQGCTYLKSGSPISSFQHSGSDWMVKRIASRAPLLEIYDPEWPGLDEKRLTCRVVLRNRGTVRIYVRATFAHKEGLRTVIDTNVPDKGDSDQQNLPATVCEVEVE